MRCQYWKLATFAVCALRDRSTSKQTSESISRTCQVTGHALINTSFTLSVGDFAAPAIDHDSHSS